LILKFPKFPKGNFKKGKKQKSINKKKLIKVNQITDIKTLTPKQLPTYSILRHTDKESASS
jgi:hypothetical protein